MMTPYPIRLRRPKPEDAAVVCDLVIACDVEDFGSPDFDLGELLDMWSGFDLQHNVWVAENAGGQIVGYAFLEEDSEEKLFSYGFVLPSARGTGVGTALLTAIESRADELASASGRDKRLQNVVPTLREDAQTLLRTRGFVPVRLFKRMSIRLEAAPAAPDLPAGITLAPFLPGVDEQDLYAAYIEAFADHWDFAVPGFDTWAEQIGRPSFRPEWWLIARGRDGDIAGFALGRMREDTLYLNQIGVLRSFRGQGLGLALLQTAFLKAYAAGQPNISLGVDTSNPSGAFRLYEKAGMRAVYEVTVAEKTIQPGSPA
ncbi:GNAT family acetyltransferase [Paenibacillus mucilaginosus 3016]|uniref:GNAT family acetyltransferase n=1 Tax=Paenibacillus mucilaginosus 3016 TaxID=1116391 RepID=H6NFD2_9BACL|nr:GNAT family N-acetyltransferase [Paenibacillus mucilaginosus]AFC29541.1 GNAT family acetyltransferase [Paenibacillus mucilaginosus 3016]WFA18235.1 GNAT family N-acetyltransferase [Paenibacillus mucilaginosus]